MYLWKFINPVHVRLSRKKLQDILKGTPPQHFKETKQALESVSDMAGMLELPPQKFKTTMISMRKALMDKVDSMQEQMGSIGREMGKKKLAI